MDEKEYKTKTKKLAMYTSLYWLLPLAIILVADVIEINAGLVILSVIVLGSGVGLIVNFHYIWEYVKILQNEIAERNEH